MVKDLVTQFVSYFSRKFILATSSLAGGFYLVLEGRDVTAFTGLVLVVLGTYAGANVAELATNLKSKRPPEPASISGTSGGSVVNVDMSSGT